MKVIADYNYIYDYIASGNDNYNYLKSCDQLQWITITDYPMPDVQCVIFH